jgi:hypothetical protein
MGLTVFFVFNATGRSEDEPPPPEGVEVLARGPIHEAYAEPAAEKPIPGKILTKQPPPTIEEVPPDQRPDGENVVWLPGYWSWDDDRNDYIWVSGIWRMTPPGRAWVPGTWTAAAGGWQWTPGFWSVGQLNNLQYLPQPPAPLNAVASTPAPNPGSTFVPGVWVYRETRYVWRPGYWVNYRPGWVWVPAHYVWTPAGWVFVEGYWDFELERRGLLFAPVYFSRPFWTVRTWAYHPRFCIHTDFLFGALFVRTGYSHYYFGDYFAAGYATRGFTAWINFHVGGVYDPLFSYYRWSYRDNHEWLGGMRTLYAGRFAGSVVRPPHTLIEQNTVIKNVTVNKITNVNYINGIAPLARMNREVVSLRPVTAEQRTQFHQSARDLNTFSATRATEEKRIVVRHQTAPAAHAVAESVKFDRPHPAEVRRLTERNTPPPAPHIAARPAARPEPAPRPQPHAEKPGTERPHVQPKKEEKKPERR